MLITDKSMLARLFFGLKGRISRQVYWLSMTVTWTVFYTMFRIIETTISYQATWILYPLLFWTLLAGALKRLHDCGRNSYYLLLMLIPVLGPIMLFYTLGFRRGKRGENIYGPEPAPDTLIALPLKTKFAAA